MRFAQTAARRGQDDLIWLAWHVSFVTGSVFHFFVCRRMTAGGGGRDGGLKTGKLKREMQKTLLKTRILYSFLVSLIWSMLCFGEIICIGTLC